jgi:hypothetical protein
MTFQSRFVLRTAAHRPSSDFVLTGVWMPVKGMPEDLMEDDSQVFVHDYNLSPACGGRRSGLRQTVPR